MAGADDVVKAALKLIAGGTKEAAPKARLPMDLDNRMYRASEMGFDPTRRYYHLTRKDFDAFKLGADPSSHTGGGAIWLREDPRYNISAHQVPSFEAEGARDIPLFIRPTKELPTMEWSLLRQQGKLNDQFPLVVTPEENKMLRDMGYSHASLGGETVVFDPKDLRSPHAAFDPDEAESADYMKSSGGSIREGYGPGGWVDDIVKMAGKVIEGEGDNVTRLSDVKSARARDALIKQLKSSINQVKSGHFQAGRQALINQKSLDLHKSGMLPLQQGTIVTPPSTWDMPGDWRVSGYWYDEKDPRRFGYRLQNESGQTYDAAASDPRAGLKRDNPYSFGAGFKAYAGPNAAPPKPVASPVEKPAIAPKPPEVLDAINKEYEDLFGPEDPFKPKAHGGRISKGPGGWLDDVVKMAGKVISGEGEEAAKTGIRAYQGSPHNFAAERLVRFPTGKEEYLVGQPDVLPDVPKGAEVLQDFPLGRMRMDKIGTGEGAQAYGHGLYFAESEPVAKGYRDALSRPLNTGDLGRDLANYAVTQKRGSIDDAVAYLNREMANYDNRPAGWPSPEYKKQYEDALGILTSGNWKPAGHMYEVNINADPNAFLDWDKPLSEQGGVDRFAKLPEFARPLDAEEAENLIGQRLHQRLANKLGEGGASSTLREAGIPGIKYLDAGSRGAGDGTRNYVVFDDKLISIIRKYGIAGASAMLGYNLMEQLDPKQALAASMADQDYQASRPQRSTGGNNSISGALNVARGLNGGE